MSSKNEGHSDTLRRLKTGNDALDQILGGGFPANSINILMGAPGSGKTILAEHLMFANAGAKADGDERPILFLTTLSEPLQKVVRYLQQFNFYDEEQLVGGVVYDAIGDQLAEEGIGALATRLREAIVEQKPKIIVIDSFKAIHDIAPSVAEMRRMLHEVAGLLTAYETTAFFVGEYNTEQLAVYPEFAVADAIVALARNEMGTRDERFLRVLKLRGSSYLEGLHGFRITPDGLDVYTRLVSPTEAPSYELSKEVLPTGIGGLDKLLDGGFRRGRSTFLLGMTGAGKTTFATQFLLEGLRRNEACLYVSFEENPTQLRTQMTQMGVDARVAEKLHFLYTSPVELWIDSIVSTVFARIRKNDIRRVVIDAVGDLLATGSDARRLHSYLYALAQHFAVRGVSCVFTYDIASGPLDTGFSALADNIIELSLQVQDNVAKRALRVVKSRTVQHSLNVHPFTITKSGVVVG